AAVRGLAESSRGSAEAATSRADTLRVLTRRATSLAGRLQSSLIGVALIQSHCWPRHRHRAASRITSITTAGSEYMGMCAFTLRIVLPSNESCANAIRGRVLFRKLQEQPRSFRA